MNRESRTFDENIEIRVNDSGQEVISGYAIVFNKESRNLGGFIERIDPSAMQGADVSDVVALFNHDQNLILGRTPSTLSLSIDERGVKYDIVPPETQTAKDLMVSIRRGDVRGSSFGFTVKEGGDKWDKPATKTDPWQRTITGFNKIWDVSPVVTPAYVDTDTSVAKRELGMIKDKVEREETEAIELEKQKQKLAEERKQKEIELKKLEVDSLERSMEKIANKYKEDK